MSFRARLTLGAALAVALAIVIAAPVLYFVVRDELRGQVDDKAQIEALEKAARGVTGVRAVTNLLHLPGETPANVAGTPGVS